MRRRVETTSLSRSSVRLPLEADAVEAFFDETYDRLVKIYRKQTWDTNAYINVKVGGHTIVLSYMPGMGKSIAASTAIEPGSTGESVKGTPLQVAKWSGRAG
ncbi:hypothetical protein AJ78_01441 [Emergomyces pasteurianus Ep9510]|uniref:Uncharacterized protein n=1 Tax=Emergomyces pasteurianus Ep9510 TaxID=1447872 RepID=A0A1J9QTC0_9EURO|nr:hypothetical protein AJ78_01441 [Emergomyces pasteurianus Ep9510]